MFSKKEHPLVSVVTPMYNCEKYIGRCLNSILKQKYTNIEVFVVDDGSSDLSGNIVKKYAEGDERVRYIYQKNSGPGAARNRAIAGAKGKYLLFVDSDDYISANYICDLVECAERNCSELVIAGYTLVYEKSEKKKVVIPERYIKNEAEEWAYRISACCSRMYLRDFWNKSDLAFHQEQGARAEDVPIALYTNAMAKNISIVKNAGYFYYQHHNSAMNRKNRKVIFNFPYDAFKRVIRKIRDEKIENGIDFWRAGILKFLTQFDLGIYRKASKSEKEKYRVYISEVLFGDWDLYVFSWQRVRKHFTFVYRISIGLFIKKYTVLKKRIENEQY